MPPPRDAMCYNEEKIQFFFHGVSLHQKKAKQPFCAFCSRRVVFQVFRFNNEVSLCIVDFCYLKLFIILLLIFRDFGAGNLQCEYVRCV
jgi:hypothetical protein